MHHRVVLTINITNLNLLSGTNYFWLTYDISRTARIYNVVDAELNSLVVDSRSRIPAQSGAITGKRIILAPISGDYTVGVGGDFANLYTAFEAVASVGLGGNSNFKIISDIVEPHAAYLRGGSVPVEPYTLKIFPTGAPRKIECNDESVIRIVGYDYIYFDGSLEGTGTDRSLTIVNTSTGTKAAGFRLLRSLNEFGCNIHNAAIKNTIIYNSYNSRESYGIYIGRLEDYNLDCNADNQDILIENNHIYNTLNGIYIVQKDIYNQSVKNVNILNNKIGNSNQTISIGGTGIYVDNVQPRYDQTSDVALMNIVGNEIFNIKKGNDGTNGVVGISVSSCRYIDIKSNLIHNLSSSSGSGSGPIGMAFTGNSFVNIINNAVYGIDGIGSNDMDLAPKGIYMSNNTDMSFWFNTVMMNGRFTVKSTYAPNYSFAFYFNYWNVYSNINMTFKNNLLANTMTCDVQTAMPFVFYDPARLIFKLGNPDYNDYYAPYLALFKDGSYINNIPDFQTLTEADESSFSEEPYLTSSTDLRPTIDSPLLFSGYFYDAIATDITGAARQNPPAIGAYEYINSDAIAPPVVVAPKNRIYGVENSPCLFKWRTVGLATVYDLQLTTDSLFAEENVLLIENIVDTTLNRQLNDLTRYYFRVRSRNDMFTSIWSKKTTFFTKGELAIPQLILPANQYSSDPNALILMD